MSFLRTRFPIRTSCREYRRSPSSPPPAAWFSQKKLPRGTMQVYVAVIFAYGVSGKFSNFSLWWIYAEVEAQSLLLKANAAQSDNQICSDCISLEVVWLMWNLHRRLKEKKRVTWRMILRLRDIWIFFFFLSNGMPLYEQDISDKCFCCVVHVLVLKRQGAVLWLGKQYSCHPLCNNCLNIVKLCGSGRDCNQWEALSLMRYPQL